MGWPTRSQASVETSGLGQVCSGGLGTGPRGSQVCHEQPCAHHTVSWDYGRGSPTFPSPGCCEIHGLLIISQDSDNPDLRDRGYIYWRLLSTDPVAAKEVVLAEKPLISEETDLIEPTLLDELICYIGTLASVYHKPPSAFVEGGRGVVHKSLPPRTAS